MNLLTAPNSFRSAETNQTCASMATEPMAWQRRGSADSLDEWAGESWTEGATGGHKLPLPGKQAPRAEPEEDIDAPEPGAREETPHEDLTVNNQQTPTISMEHDRPAGVSQCTPRGTQATVEELERAPKKQSEGLQAHRESENFLILVEDTSPPDPPLSASTAEEYPEIEHFSSLVGEMAECISDVELISDSTEDHKSMSGDTTQLNSLLGGLDNSDYEHSFSGAAAERNPPNSHPSSDRSNSDHAFAIDSPPFADEGEEEEEVSVYSKPLDVNPLDSSSEPPQPRCSRNSSTNSEQDPASAQPAVPPGKQQGEQLPQNQPGRAPRGANQEAAQQVLSQDSPPLSTVAMEPANRGAAASQGSGCVAARERNRRAGGRREGESRWKGQKESRLDKAVGVKWSTRRVLEYSKKVRKQEQKKEIYRVVSSKHSRATRMESDSCDDSQSDSGVSADFSPCSTLESHATIPTGTPATLANETPIEREIRRAIERERSLRRSRGLQNPPTTPEYVEIPLRKSILSKSLPAQSERSKDRQFAGKKMQQEIHAEAQREQDLVRLGKVPGIYDKGTVRQLKERKQLFEAFKEPGDSSCSISTKSKASRASASDISTLGNREGVSSPASKLGGSFAERRRSVDPPSQKRSPTSALAKGGGSSYSSPRGPGFSDGTGCQVIILENNQALYPPKPLQRSSSSGSFTEAEALAAVDSGAFHSSPSRRAGCGDVRGTEDELGEEEEEDAVPRENPFFKLRSSTALVKVEQDIREAQERERELRKQRSSLYGGTGGGGGGGRGRGGGRPASTERQSPTFPPLLLNGLATPDLPASPAARQSLGKLGMWPPAQAEEEHVSRPEALLSPRTPRQKTPLLQRWESGLVNGHGEEEDDDD